MQMKAVVLEGPNKFGPQMIEKPVIGEDEILLKMKKRKTVIHASRPQSPSADH